jgi:hypothetical protein
VCILEDVGLTAIASLAVAVSKPAEETTTKPLCGDHAAARSLASPSGQQQLLALITRPKEAALC